MATSKKVLGTIFLAILASLTIFAAFNGPLEIFSSEIGLKVDNSSTQSIPQLTEEEVLAITHAIEEINQFIEDHANFEEYVWFDNVELWYVDLWASAADDALHSEENYLNSSSITSEGFASAYAIIDDASAQVLDYEVSSLEPLEATLMENEVISLVEGNEIVQDFQLFYPNSEITAWYDGYGFWTVIIDEEGIEGGIVSDYESSSDRLEVTVSEEFEGIIEIYSTVPVGSLNLSEGEAILLASTLPEISEFLINSSYNITWTSLRFIYGETMSITWNIDIYSWTEDEDFFAVTVLIDDTTSTILEIDLTEIPDLTKSEAIAIALVDAEIQEFIGDYPNYEINAFYDGFGIWYVEFYSTVFLDAWAYAFVDDDASSVISTEIYYPEELPSLTVEEAMEIAENITEIASLLENYPNISSSIFYLAGEWSIFYLDHVIIEAWAWIVIDDNSGTVLDLFVGEPFNPPSRNLGEILNITAGLSETQQFILDHPTYEVDAFYISYGTLGGDETGSWFVYYHIEELEWADFYLGDPPPGTTLEIVVDDYTGIILSVELY